MPSAQSYWAVVCPLMDDLVVQRLLKLTVCLAYLLFFFKKKKNEGELQGPYISKE